MSADVICKACSFENECGERFCLRCDARLPQSEGPVATTRTDSDEIQAEISRRESGRAAAVADKRASGGSTRTAPEKKASGRAKHAAPSADGQRPGQAKPEDFPNSILRRVAAGETVDDDPNKAFVRKEVDSESQGLPLTLEARLPSHVPTGEERALGLRFSNLEGAALDLEVHVSITAVDLVRHVACVKVEGHETGEVSFPFVARQPGRKHVVRIDAAYGTVHGDLRIIGVPEPRELYTDAVGSSDRPRAKSAWRAVPLALLEHSRLADGLQEVLAGARSLEKPKELLAAVAPRSAPHLLCLRFEDDPRRIFVVQAGTESRFGRKKPKGSTTGNDLVFRLLPCRSQEQDPEHWKQTMAISGTHGSFQLGLEGLSLRTDGRHGVVLNGRRLEANDTAELPAVFVLMLAGVLRLKGRVYAPTVDAPLLDVRSDHPLPGGAEIGASFPGPIDCLHLRRVANKDEHEYLLLYRAAGIGSSPICPVHVSRGEGVAPIHARLLRHQGVVLIAPDRGSDTPVSVDGRRLHAHQVAPLAPGADVRLGATRLFVEPARPGDLVRA